MVEADEVSFAYSYKGTKPVNMPRPSRKRGINKEQVCVGTALDRQGNIIIEMLCTARVTANELERLYENRIGESLFFVQPHIQFATDMELEHKRIKKGRHSLLKVFKQIYEVAQMDKYIQF